MRRTIRCVDGFADGLCREPGCPHEERRGSGLRRQKPKVCKTCRGPASVKAWDSGWLCEGCASIKAERGPRGPLYLLTALMLALGCEGCGPEFPGSPEGLRCGDLALQVSEREPPGAGRCVRVLLPDGLDVSLSMTGDCPGPERCLVALEGEGISVWVDHDPTAEEDRLVNEAEEYADAEAEACSLACP